MQTRDMPELQSPAEILHELRSTLTPALLLLGRLESDSTMSASNLEDVAVIRATIEKEVELLDALRGHLQ